MERTHPLDRRVAGFRQIDGHAEDVVRTKARIDRSHPQEALEEEAGAGQQHQRNGDLGDDERAPRAIGLARRRAQPRREGLGVAAPRETHRGREEKIGQQRVAAIKAETDKLAELLESNTTLTRQDKDITEDDRRHAAEKIEGLTKEYVERVEKVLKTKEDEIMAV